MSIVKAKCLKCNEVIDVDSGEDAGICPKCGAAYVTEKAIKNYNDTVTNENAAKTEFEELSALAKKYHALVKLYKTDYRPLLELYRVRAKIWESEDELEEFCDKHNKMVDDREQWRNRYNSRAEGYNDSGYNAYEFSVSEAVHKKYVDSAKKKHDNLNEKIRASREGFDKKGADCKALVDKENEMADEVYAEVLEYNIKAGRIVKEMCDRYPSNPLGYLYNSDWFLRDVERGKGVLKFIGEKQSGESGYLMEIAENDTQIHRSEQMAWEEYEKAQKLMTESFNKEYAELVKPLKKATKPKKTSAVIDDSNATFATSMPKNKQSGAAAKAKTGGKKFGVGLNWVASVACLLPIIAELLFVLLIAHIDVLNQNETVSRIGWEALSVPMKVAFLSVVVLGAGVQVLGLFDKLNNFLGMFTQFVTFALFALSVLAAGNNAESVYTQWGLAAIVPVSLIVSIVRYIISDGKGIIDEFGFWHYLTIALEVAEYALFFLVFPLLFGVSASLWMFIALTVTTVAAIAVALFWEDFRWLAVGINLAVAVLLCVVYWLGILFSSEWMWSGGIIIVVILAIGGSIFLHWFIHRNDV